MASSLFKLLLSISILILTVQSRVPPSLFERRVPPPCSAPRFGCAKGFCIPSVLACDGVLDCGPGDYSDEVNCTTPEWQIQCDNYCTVLLLSHTCLAKSRRPPFETKPRASQIVAEYERKICGQEMGPVDCIMQRSSQCGPVVSGRRGLWLSRTIQYLCNGARFTEQVRQLIEPTFGFLTNPIGCGSAIHKVMRVSNCFDAFDVSAFRDFCSAYDEQAGAVKMQEIISTALRCFGKQVLAESDCSKEDASVFLKLASFIRVPGSI